MNSANHGKDNRKLKAPMENYQSKIVPKKNNELAIVSAITAITHADLESSMIHNGANGGQNICPIATKSIFDPTRHTVSNLAQQGKEESNVVGTHMEDNILSSKANSTFGKHIKSLDPLLGMDVHLLYNLDDLAHVVGLPNESNNHLIDDSMDDENCENSSYHRDSKKKECSSLEEEPYCDPYLRD